MKIPIAGNLIQKVLQKDKGALQIRALMLWAAMYPAAQQQQVFSTQELMEQIESHTVAYKQRIINTAVHMKLFTKGKRRHSNDAVYHRTGKNNVYLHHLSGEVPGKLIYFDVADIKERELKRLRAVLHHTFVAAKPRIRSRAVQAKMTGYTEQTTRNWSRTLKADGDLFVKTNHYTAKSPYSGKTLVISQAPNTYIVPQLYEVRTDNVQQSWDESASNRVYMPTIDVHTKHMKRYYADEATAKKAWELRQRKANNNAHFQPIDTYYPEMIEHNGRHYQGLRRVRPHTAHEIPEDIMVADELAHDAEIRQWEHEECVRSHRNDNALLDKMHSLATFTALQKPARKRNNNTTNQHTSTLTFAQQIELLIRPELACLLN